MQSQHTEGIFFYVAAPAGVKLVDPTGFDILEAFEDGRNVATNIAAELGYDRAYLNTRLPHLQDHGLLEKIGPAANSGLYDLTDRGQAASQPGKYARHSSSGYDTVDGSPK